MLSKLDGVVSFFKNLDEVRKTLEKAAVEHGPFAFHDPVPETTPIIVLMRRLSAETESVIPSIAAHCSRVADMMTAGSSVAELLEAFREMRRRGDDEIKRIHVYCVRPDLVPCYQSLQPFGAELADRFPKAVDDIEGASKCLALGQGTAVVLHLMRVMEVGLKALAEALGIPYVPSWEGYLKQISDRIGAKHETKSVDWRQDEPFYRDVNGDLLVVKQSFRNPTMHVVRKYTPEEAEEIYRAVRTFMRRLADGLSKK